MTEEELFQHVCGKELGETNLDKIESEVRNLNIFLLDCLKYCWLYFKELILWIQLQLDYTFQSYDDIVLGDDTAAVKLEICLGNQKHITSFNMYLRQYWKVLSPQNVFILA